MVYQGCVNTTLHYGIEAGSLCSCQEYKINTFHLHSLRRIMALLGKTLLKTRICWNRQKCQTCSLCTGVVRSTVYRPAQICMTTSTSVKVGCIGVVKSTVYRAGQIYMTTSTSGKNFVKLEQENILIFSTVSLQKVDDHGSR